MKKRIISMLLVLVMLAGMMPALGITVGAADTTTPETTKTNSIDLYLIAGQSNASGTSTIKDAEALYDVAPELRNGIGNVLYSGKYAFDAPDKDYVDWTPTKLGFGHRVYNTDGSVRAERLGPEAGMAVALSKYYNAETGKVAGIFKYAHGGSQLSGNATSNSWASPSYYDAVKAAYSWGDYATNANESTIGRHYVEFLNVFKAQIQSLLDKGYTDINIKGIYWMQGEADRAENNPSDPSYYGTALEYFIGDLRADLSKAMKEVFSATDDGGAANMPFFIGSISETFGLVSATEIVKNRKFIEIQKDVVSKVANCYFIDNSQYKLSRYDAATNTAVALGSDTYHWHQNDALEIGKSVGYDMHNLGVVPDEYPAFEYPFAVFINGEFVGAYKRLYGSSDSADVTDYAMYAAWKNEKGKFRGVHNDEINIVLRSDYNVTSSTDSSFNGMAQIAGPLVINFNGNTLTMDGTMHFLNYQAKYGVDPAAGSINHIYPSNFVIKNGDIVTNGSTVLSYSSMPANGSTNVLNRYDAEKLTNILFDRVNISAKSCLISTNDTIYNAEKGALTNVTFNNCNFDISRITETATLFDGTDNGLMNDINIKVNGGNITASQITNITLSTLNDDDTFVFGVGSGVNGGYTTLTMPTTAELKEFGAMNDVGESVVFANGVVDGDNTVYSLPVPAGVVVTKYGTIPSEYADAEAYPFAIFTNGKFVSACAYWSATQDEGAQSTVSVLQSMLKYLRGTYTTQYQILLRRDYDVSTSGNSTSNFVNFGQIGGEWLLDLGKNKLTFPSNQNMLFVQAKYGMDDLQSRKNHIYPSSIIVENGTVNTSSAVISASSTNLVNEKWDTVKNVTITYNNVEFNVPSAGILETTTFAHPIYGLDLTLTLNDCEINLKSNNTTLFKGEASTVNNRVDVVVNGGKINSGAYTGTKIVNFPASEDTLTLGKGENGYLEYTATKAGAPAGAFNTTENGVSYFGRYSPADATAHTYRLGENTKYGVIPYDYTAEEYPFAVFTNGELMGAYSILIDNKSNTTDIGTVYNRCYGINSAFEMARGILYCGKHSNAQILMRRNYTFASGEGVSFNNLAQFDGDLVIDLNEFTLTHNNTTSMLAVAAKQSWTGSKNVIMPTSITLKNGTFNTKAALVNLYTVVSESYDNAEGHKVLNYTFEDLNVVYIDATYPALIAHQNLVQTSNTGKQGDFNITLNNCTLDLSALKQANVALVIGKDRVETQNLNDVNVVVNGGKIITNATKVTAGTFNEIVGENGDSLKFGKYDGKYTTFTGANVPTDVFTTTERYTAVFGKVGDTYTLVPNEFKIIGAYLNIQENINVCYAVGLPAGYTNPYMVFEFNGNKYTVNEYTVDATGKLIFKFVGVVPQMIGDNISATLYATKDGETVSDSVAEYSVKTYCVNMIAKEPENTKLVTLLSDLLVYGAKAQIYMNYKTDALVTEGLTLIPSTFTAPTKSDKTLVGEADASVSWKGVALRYENAMAIKLSFVASADYTLKISINGRTVEYKVSDLAKEGDNYVVYFRGIEATEYANVVTATFYNADGVQVGQSAQYSVNSYVFSKHTGNDTLADLVKATYNYGVSAENYVK